MKNIKKIELNKRYKYKDLCNLFKEKPLNGNSKIAQIKTWEQYFKIEKAPKANYIITEIYDKKKAKVTRGKNNNSHNNKVSEYNVYLEPLIIDYLKKQNKNTIIETNNKLCYSVGFFNTFIKWDAIKTSAKEMKIDIETAEDFYAKLISMQKTPIITALNKLEKAGYIKVKTGYAIYENGADNYRMATEKEEFLIRRLEEIVLKELDIDSKSKLMYKYNLKSMFYEKLDKLIKEKIKDTHSVLKAIEINILDTIYDIKIDENINELKNKLNILITSKISTYFIYQKNKTKLKLNELMIEAETKKQKYDDCWGEAPKIKAEEVNVWEQHRLSSDYLNDINKLVDKLIKIT